MFSLSIPIAIDPIGYMKRVFEFLDVDEPTNWKEIISFKHANANKSDREPMFPETEKVLLSHTID